jgi:hypothetical protein
MGMVSMVSMVSMVRVYFYVIKPDI